MRAIDYCTQGNPGCAHDGIEMCHRLFERGVIERPAFDRKREFLCTWLRVLLAGA
jgi:hypothetical protein